MRHGRRWLFAGVVVATLGAASARAQDCTGLSRSPLAEASVAAATVPAGEHRPAGAAAPLRGLPAFCRVEGVIQPVPGSRIGFELWLPATGWNGRLLMVGNGGYSSAIAFAEMAGRLREGWAVVGTDTGHAGDDPDFAAGRPESIADWGHRAVHETAVRAKALVERFYGGAPRRSYFAGCSTGGHQAFAEAQRYPEDFDGILAGAPGHNRTRLNAAFLWQYLRNHEPRNDGAQIIPAAKLPMISRAVLAACRPNNGTLSGGLPTDAFLNDPTDCAFDPGTLQCRAGDGEDCLTAPQVEALRAMYRGAHDPRTGQRIAFPFPHGSENSGQVVPTLPGWSLYWADPRDARQPARVNFWRVWAFDDPRWSWWTFDFGRDMARVDDRLAGTVNAMSPDLERFRARGGRLLQYHGLADPVVPFLDSISYAERVVALRAERGGLSPGAARAEAGSFHRLFLVPGMEHCRGGLGPDRFDALPDLVRWVEEGVAPERIVAAHVVGERATFSRPLCPFPQQARYRGEGDPNDAASFECRADGRPREYPRLGADHLR